MRNGALATSKNKIKSLFKFIF